MGAKSPTGLTPKQEDFVQAFLETGNASEAYKRAYNVKPTTKNETIRVSAAKLLSDPNITLRVSELQERASAKVVLTRAWVLERLMRNADKALELEDVTASNKALELLGKVDELSMFVERQNVTSDNRHHHTAEPLSPFAEFLEGAVGSGAKGPTEGSVPN